jgi:hypothetical protein
VVGGASNTVDDAQRDAEAILVDPGALLQENGQANFFHGDFFTHIRGGFHQVAELVDGHAGKFGVGSEVFPSGEDVANLPEGAGGVLSVGFHGNKVGNAVLFLQQKISGSGKDEYHSGWTRKQAGGICFEGCSGVARGGFKLLLWQLGIPKVGEMFRGSGGFHRWDVINCSNGNME